MNNEFNDGTLAYSTQPVHICLEQDVLKQMDSFSLQQYTNKSLFSLQSEIPELCKCGKKYNYAPVLLSVHHKTLTKAKTVICYIQTWELYQLKFTHTVHEQKKRMQHSLSRKCRWNFQFFWKYVDYLCFIV